jgi:predicted RNA-binding Zn ribbon-like protein
MGVERWSWLGGPLAVDFANTVRRHGTVYVELLIMPGDFRAWAAREQLDPGEGFDLHEIRAFRDDVFRALRAATRRESPADGVRRRLNAAVNAAPLVPQLDEHGQVTLCPSGDPAPLDELLARIAASALELVDNPDLALCDASGCGQFFLRGRTGQRWCSPECGNRERVARHKRRG